MKTDNRKADKTDGCALEPVRAVTCDNRTFEAVHHVVNSTEQTLGLYIDERDGGIDLKIPLSNVVGIAKSAAGARAVDASDEETERMRLGDGSNGKAQRHDRVSESEEDDELAADGGR